MLTKTRVIVSLKLLFGLGLIALLLNTVDFDSVINRFRNIKLEYLFIVLIFPHLALFIVTIRWRVLLKAASILVPLNRLFGLNLVGVFFSNFLPTMVGGDAVKSFTLIKETGKTETVLAATFMDRLVGLTGLICMLPIILFRKEITESVSVLGVGLLSIFVAFLILLVLVFTPLFELVGRLPIKYKIISTAVDFLLRTHRTVRLFLKYRGPLLMAFLLSISFYFMSVIAPWAAAKSIGIDVEYWYLIGFVPIVLLSGILPVSLNGLGVTEAGYAFFLQLAGVPLEDAVVIALILRLRLVVSGLIGGVVFIQYRPKRVEVVGSF